MPIALTSAIPVSNATHVSPFTNGPRRIARIAATVSKASSRLNMRLIGFEPRPVST